MYIDVHHHFNAPGGRSGRPDWSPRSTVAAMDAAGVCAAIGWPGPVVAADAASSRTRARFLNEFGAGIVQDHPTRFGLFASLPPLTDVEGALHEIAYAFDQLQADGIGLLTHYGDTWLGDPSFVPVFEELNRRAAVVFVHPTASGGTCACGTLGYQTADVSQAWLEYPFNTARTILNLMVAGTLRRFPDIRFIFCHGGGAFTALLSRITGFKGWFEMGQERLDALFPRGVEAEFERLHFECAQAYAPQNMALLRSLVPTSQILFGTDFDRFSLQHSVEQFEQLDLSEDVRSAIAYGNARRLFSRLPG
ncbi:amidohydrolase family protein [Pantoea sp. 18069]|uniref:amidohydrolase family protein n=1 Tax=Pantoea sp. 18069 TaxID=2681415 RepID=UPI001359A426|nr:amidohydrolase family protein [Pantoea sp. 18069]